MDTAGDTWGKVLSCGPALALEIVYIYIPYSYTDTFSILYRDVNQQ